MRNWSAGFTIVACTKNARFYLLFYSSLPGYIFSVNSSSTILMSLLPLSYSDQAFSLFGNKIARGFIMDGYWCLSNSN